MLKTLDNYIAPSPAGRSRFARLFALSAILHIFFYGWLIRLDMSTARWSESAAAGGTELVMLTEVAPPPARAPLRSAPEPVEQTDIDHMEFNPERADDVHLRSRSPKRGSNGAETAPPGSPRETARNPVSTPAPPSPAKSQAVSPPPGTVIIPQPSLQSSQPAPILMQNTEPSNNAPPPARTVTRAEGNSGTAEVGFETIKAQYMAQVRSKIRKANERIMPRKWIADMLTEKVSADYDLLLGRGGKIVSLRLVRSSGYSQLDDVAKQAIYMVSPYEGYPQEAGETILLTVRVHYNPLW